MREILAYLRRPHRPSHGAGPGPPLWEMADAGHGQFDRNAQPAPDYEFDLRIAE